MSNARPRKQGGKGRPLDSERARELGRRSAAARARKSSPEAAQTPVQASGRWVDPASVIPETAEDRAWQARREAAFAARRASPAQQEIDARVARVVAKQALERRREREPVEGLNFCNEVAPGLDSSAGVEVSREKSRGLGFGTSEQKKGGRTTPMSGFESGGTPPSFCPRCARAIPSGGLPAHKLTRPQCDPEQDVFAPYRDQGWAVSWDPLNPERVIWQCGCGKNGNLTVPQLDAFIARHMAERHQ